MRRVVLHMFPESHIDNISIPLRMQRIFKSVMGEENVDQKKLDSKFRTLDNVEDRVAEQKAMHVERFRALEILRRKGKLMTLFEELPVDLELEKRSEMSSQVYFSNLRGVSITHVDSQELRDKGKNSRTNTFDELSAIEEGIRQEFAEKEKELKTIPNELDRIMAKMELNHEMLGELNAASKKARQDRADLWDAEGRERDEFIASRMGEHMDEKIQRELEENPDSDEDLLFVAVHGSKHFIKGGEEHLENMIRDLKETYPHLDFTLQVHPQEDLTAITNEFENLEDHERKEINQSIAGWVRRFEEITLHIEDNKE